MQRTVRMRRGAAWLLLAAAIAAPVLFIVVRDRTPSDGARVAFYERAWSAAGIAIQPIDRPAAGLEDGDVVTSVGGRSLEAWAQAAFGAGMDRPDAGAPIPYEVRRDGASTRVDVTWTRPAMEATLVGGWGVIVFSIAFTSIAAFVFARRPDEPAAIPLVLAASGAAGSSVPWFMGATVSDVVHGGPFLLHSIVTGPLYMLLWPATVHLALVFPAPIRQVERRPWLVPAVYVLGFAGYAILLVAGRLASPTVLDWVGTWPMAQLALVVPMLSLSLVLVVTSYLRVRDPVSRARLRWAAYGGATAIAISLAVFWLPELIIRRPLLDFSWLAVFALPFPLGLAAGILRHRLFDIDVVVNRTIVYGGLTAGVLASYAVTVAVLGSVVGPEHGYGVSLLASGVAALAALPLRDGLQRAVNRMMYGHRDEPWRAMRHLGQRLEWAADPDRAFPAIVEAVADSLRLPYVALAVLDEDGTEATVAAAGTERGAAMVLPLVHGAQPVGSLVLGVRAGEQGFSDTERSLLEDLARQAGTAIHAMKLRADLARSRERLVLAREEERRRLRRDLHDGLGPTLAAIGMRAEAASASLTSDPASAARLLDELGGEIRVALADVRRLVDGLRPPALDELGLLGAIEQQATRLEGGGARGTMGISLSVEGRPQPLPDLPAAVEVAAYRIAVEALTNAVRHSGARTCRVLVEAADALTVEVVDDGRGLPRDVVPGVGLESIRARADELGGTLRLERRPHGTRVLARLPLEVVAS